MNDLGFADYKTILHQTTDVLPRVGVGDLTHFIGIEPDLVLAAFEHRCGKALLETQVTESCPVNNLRVTKGKLIWLYQRNETMN